MTTQFTDDEIETIKSLICNHGSDCPGTDYQKVLELSYKLGLEQRPTPEELEAEEKRNKEFRESELGKRLAELFTITNVQSEKLYNRIIEDNIFCKNIQWPIGSELKIKLPNDYLIKNK